MSYSYLASYFPPMPVLEVQLGFPDDRLRVGPLAAIVDTGADGSLVPQAWLDEIGAPLVDEVRIRSQWGEWRNVKMFTIDLGIGDVRLPSIEVVGDDLGEEIVLGRNVLNRLKLLLDGPHGRTELLHS
jgi:predicted aspartyl protease